ncbi:uncharacterized protein HKW66_Vig0144620 [Vigna angularis]|uniref:Uncharacterized protein n=1 Tax=Phaseolus angularis TaxID=3914 RepID=A0A8T0KEH0_PHAAN|nr:uncharacterized protein HKW66_Vig0144620 [Vigna angularis]
MKGDRGGCTPRSIGSGMSQTCGSSDLASKNCGSGERLCLMILERRHLLRRCVKVILVVVDEEGEMILALGAMDDVEAMALSALTSLMETLVSDDGRRDCTGCDTCWALAVDITDDSLSGEDGFGEEGRVNDVAPPGVLPRRISREGYSLNPFHGEEDQGLRLKA